MPLRSRRDHSERLAHRGRFAAEVSQWSLAAGQLTEIQPKLKHKPGTSKVQVEVDSIEQLKKVVEFPIDMVLLDNMSPEQVESAVKVIPKGILIEVSGGITPEKIAGYKHLPIHRISMGCLTGANHQVDIGLDFEAKLT